MPKKTEKADLKSYKPENRTERTALEIGQQMGISYRDTQGRFYKVLAQNEDGTFHLEPIPGMTDDK